jgi:hypothetical protein
MGNVNHGSSDFRSTGLATHARPRWRRASGWAAMLLAAGFVACSSPPSATAAGGSEASALVSPAIAMEEFETSFASGSCGVKWRGNPTLTVEQCKTALAPQSVPIVVAGITYAVWATESCSSGGACAGMQFYAVTTDGSRAWASPAFGQGYRLTRILPRADGITLHLESATTSAEPVEFELRMGDLRKGAPGATPAPSVPAEPAPLEEEPKVVQRPSGCLLTWQGQTLITADACDEESMSQFGHVRTVRTSHTNFYFYAVPTVVGAYGCAGNTYYLVGVTATDAWSPGSIARCTELGETKATDDGLAFTFDDANATQSCSVTGREVHCAKPVTKKRVEPKILSTRRITVTGQLSMGGRLQAYLPVISPPSGAADVIIDDAGPCSVEDNFDRKVQSTLRCKVLDDDSTICTCEQLRVLD